MNIEACSSILIICIIFVVCEFASRKMRYKIPSYLLVLLAVIILGGQFGIITEQHFINTGFPELVSNYGLPFALVGFGTSITCKDFKKEWQTCLIAVGAVICIVLCGAIAGATVMDMQTALYGAIEIAGGGQAGLIFLAKLREAGETELVVLITILMSGQLMVGYPLCGIALKRAMQIRLRNRSLPEDLLEKEENQAKKKHGIHIYTPEYLKENFYYVFAMLSVCCIAGYYAGKLTGVSVYVWYIIFGFMLSRLGVLEPESLEKIGVKGFIYGTMYAAILVNLTSVKITSLLELLPEIFFFLALGVIGCVICGGIFAKFLKLPFAETFAVATACMVGYPPSMKIVHETIARIDEECHLDQSTRDGLTAYYEPKIVISGIISISVLTGILAGAVVSFF